MRYRRQSGIIAGAVFILCAVACSDSVQLKVESEVPEALVQRIPLSVAVYYPPAFRDYRYTENSEERPQWDIASGAAQLAMFDRVLDSTFTEVMHLDTQPAGSIAGADLGIVPNVTDMQLATPAETGFDYYEAWFRYRIAFFDRHGVPHDNWDLAAYGKAPQKRFTVRTDGLSQAITYALRDIGAKLSTGFRQQAAVARALEGAP